MKLDDINDYLVLLIYEINISVNIYVCSRVIMSIMLVKIRLCFMVQWNSLDFRFIMFVVVQVMAIDCGEIILLVMLSLVFVVISRVSEMLICCVVVDCSELNRVLEEVFESVRNMFSQSRNGEKNGNIMFVFVSISVSVVDMLEQLVMKVNVSIMLIDSIGYFKLISVSVKMSIFFLIFISRMKIEIIVVIKIVVSLVERGSNLNIVFIGVGWAIMGVVFNIC